MRKLPELRRHRDRRRKSDRAYVLLNGRRRYLGPWGDPATDREYDRFLAEWLANDRRLPEPPTTPQTAVLTVGELVDRYEAHAKVYYRKPNGSPTGEHLNVKAALKPLKHLLGDQAAAEFTTVDLKTVRAHMVANDLSRGVVNQRVGVIRRVFRWAEGEALVPEGKFQHLKSLDNLKEGRTDARDTDPVEPVTWKHVKQTLPELSPTIRAMVLLQWHTG